MVAKCLVCQASASVYCTADKAFLCGGCDKTIHTANALVRKHQRTPVCELCHRQVASVYCQQDAAALCSVCDKEVHSANPVPHTVVPIEQSSLMIGENVPAAAMPVPAAEPAAPVPAEDEVSACGEHKVTGCDLKLEVQGLEPAPSSEANTSLAVVPEMPPAAAPSAAGPSPVDEAAPKDKDQLGKDFDLFDMDASWLDRLDAGFDFSDILADDVGLVPTLATTPADNKPPAPLPSVVPPSVMDDDLAVPSFDFCLDLPSLPTFSGQPSLKRSADDVEADMMLLHPSKMLGLDVSSMQMPSMSSMQPMRAPAPPLAPMPPPVLAAAPPAPPAPAAGGYQSTAQQAQQQAWLMAGANLTREQRVARYREKRKNRKFEKTIRYASRKAYAEVRPRIKGRFATREEVLALKAAQAAAAAQGRTLSEDEMIAAMVPNMA